MIQAGTLAELIERAAGLYPRNVAYIWRPLYRARRFTYADVYSMARGAAALLEDNSIGPGDRVVLWAVNSPFWVAAFFGCQLRGAVAVPLMAQSSPDFVSRIAGITGASAVFRSSALIADMGGIPVFDVEQAVPRDLKEPLEPPPRLEPDDIAQVLFTSGTTGNPKGVPLTHRNLLSNVRDINRLELIRPGDHLMSILPLAHSFEQAASLFTSIALGLTVTQAASLSGPHVRMNMVEDRPSVLVSVPEFLKLAMGQIEARASETGAAANLERLFRIGPKLPFWLRRALARPVLRNFGGRLRLAISGGSALDARVGQKWEALGVRVIQGYGATECSPVITANSLEDNLLSSVGKPLPSVEVKLADDGEILVRGPNVVAGYWNRPDETSERFRDGWYYTDDLGEWDGGGRLHIRGRKKFLIVTPAGENVYPEDIEGELCEEPEVRDAAVLAWQPGGVFEIHAVLLLTPEHAGADARAIAERVNARLQPHQRVQGTSVWDSEDFPRTVTRKVKKNDVRAWLETRASGAAPVSTVPAGAVERAIAQITGVPAEQVLPDMRLEADLKLDSLGRVTLAGAIEESTGLVLDEGQIGPQTTVADIRERLSKREQKQERHAFNEAPLTPWGTAQRAVWQKALIWPIASYFAPTTVTGLQHLDGLNGPVLFCPNHISPIDAAVVLRALPARFHATTAVAAASDVVFDNPAYGRYSGLLERSMNVFPFEREGQIKSSLQYTARLMDRGFSVLLYPEGRISTDGKLGEVLAGAGLIAVEMGAPVVPVWQSGTDGVVPASAVTFVRPKRHPVRISIGEPLRFLPGCPYDSAAREIRGSLESLSGMERPAG